MPIARRSLLALAAGAALLRANGEARSRLAITTDEVDDDLAVALSFMKRHALRWAEIRNLNGKYNTAQPTEVVRRARRQLDDAGVRLAVLDTGFFKVPLPDSQARLDEQWRLLDTAFRNAEILGTDLIRTFGFTFPRGGRADRAHEPRIFELAAESAERARKAGFRLALENVGGSYIGTSADAARLLAAVSEPALGLTWDPNNAAQMGEAKPFPDGYASLDSKRILHVHLRDYRRKPDGSTEWCGVGDGEFDHAGQMRRLLADGYRGVFSLETHFQIDGSKAKASEYSITRLIARAKAV